MSGRELLGSLLGKESPLAHMPVGPRCHCAPNAAYAHLANPQLAGLDHDHLYHIGLKSNSMPDFADVKYVCLGGSPDRMKKFTSFIASELTLEIPAGTNFVNMCSTDRFTLYKAGPVLCASHGMGNPSISILLHELAKMLEYSGATDYCFFRIGSSGGLGVPGGTVVISDSALNGKLEACHEISILGETVRRPTQFNKELAIELSSCADEGVKVVIGNTMCADDFYEGQARVDGAICNYTEADKMAFLHKAHGAGVVNIEMESLVFAAFTQRLNIPAACVCAVYLNRLNGDQITSTGEELAEFGMRAQQLVANFIKQREAKRK